MLETIQSILVRVLNSSLLSTFLLAVRAVTPIIALYVIWRSYTSFKKGQRRKDPVIMLRMRRPARTSPCCTGKTRSAAAAAATSRYRMNPSRATTQC